MNAPHRHEAVVSDVAVVLAPPYQQHAGILAYATLIAAGIRIAGIRIRRSAAGEIYVSFPSHRTETGWRDPYVIPVDPLLGARIEAAVVAEYLRLVGSSS